MENQTVKQLKAIARERGIKKYSRMRKAELIESLTQPQVLNTNIIEESISEINVPILKNPQRAINPILENLSVEHMRALAKDQGIKRYYWMTRPKLIEGLGDIDIDPNTLSNILDKITTKKYNCIHGKFKYQCKDCRGSQICLHNRRKTQCRECNGGSICEHKRVRYICKDCNGKGICIHGKQRCFCKDCGGSQICEHNRQKAQCKECHTTQETR